MRSRLAGIGRHFDIAFGLVGALAFFLVFQATQSVNSAAFGLGFTAAGGWQNMTSHGALFDTSAIIFGSKMEPSIDGNFAISIATLVAGFVVGSQARRLAKLNRIAVASGCCAVMIGAFIGLFALGVFNGKTGYSELVSHKSDANVGLVQQVPLNKTDVPKTWVNAGSTYLVTRGSATRANNTPFKSDVMSRYDDCLKRPHDMSTGTVAGATSFASDDFQVDKVPYPKFEVVSSASLFENEADAKAQVATMQVPNVFECIKQQQIDSADVPSQQKIVDVVAIPDIVLQPNEIGFREIYTQTQKGVTRSTYQDTITMYNGTVASQVSFIGTNETMPINDEMAYLNKMRNRTQGTALLLAGR